MCKDTCASCLKCLEAARTFAQLPKVLRDITASGNYAQNAEAASFFKVCWSYMSCWLFGAFMVAHRSLVVVAVYASVSVSVKLELTTLMVSNGSACFHCLLFHCLCCYSSASLLVRLCRVCVHLHPYSNQGS